MSDNTIIGAPFEPEKPLRSMLNDRPDPELEDAGAETVSQRLFKIRTARTPGMRRSASTLINLRYAWRGYASKPLPQDAIPDRITLVATDQEETIGTMTVNFDGEEGLLVEELFPEEVRSLRQTGHRVCEFTKLAMDSVRTSKRVLASLFHVAYIYAYRLKGFDSLLIEVNPRHVTYYCRILGFKVVGASRMNPRVNAPAVLLCLHFEHTEEQIERFGGHPEMAAAERSLYPYAFSIDEEAGIVGRLKGTSQAVEALNYENRRAQHEASLHM